jgi:glycosyltransferase involved in cell wall biosynthesis
MKTVVVVPAFHEEKRVGEVVRGLMAAGFEVVVVDDGSTDRSADVSAEAGAKVLRHAINRGQGAALRTGTEAALRLGADVIVHFDADGQHDPSFLASFIEPIASKEVDVVFGSRFLGLEAEGMPLVRRFVLVGGRFFSNYVLGIPRKMTDPQNGLRALSADAARKIRYSQDEFAHCSEILRLVTRSDLRWKEVPVRVRYTAETLAKGSRPAVFHIVWHLFLGLFS